MNVQEQGKQCQRLVYSSLVRRISCQEHWRKHVVLHLAMEEEED
jgi:hypothetical protein